MRNTKNRSLIVSILSFCFILGLGIFTFKLVVNSQSWTMTLFNKHLSGDSFANAGEILDVNNVVLAKSQDNKRVYCNDIDIRKALLHTVGDNTINITTSVQNNYKSELCGYNFIFGVNPPEILKSNKNIVLTLNSSLCKTALKKLGDEKGSVCVYNYKTGDIVAMVSTPTYDPSNIPDIKKDTTGKYEGVYINRALSAIYPPGSVFKVVTATCALENLPNAEDTVFACKKSMQVNGKNITCLGSHGSIKLQKAMEHSCNIYFANLAMTLTADKMMQTAKNLYFGKSFKINKISTKASQYDTKGANDYQLGWSGVGQYNDLVNPSHMMMIMGSIGNNGVAVVPKFIKEIKQNSNSILNLPEMSQSQNSNETIEFMNQDTAQKLKNILRSTVKNSYGDAMFENWQMCAKTGTAETGENTKPHSWMAGFSLNEETPYAFCVMVENGGSGREVAGGIASAVMKELLKFLKSN